MLTSMILHHDNAPAHRATTTQGTIAGLGFGVLEHPPYSPDLAPCDFFLFPLVKSVLRGRHFSDVNELSVAIQHAISEIPTESFKESFVSWVDRSNKCISCQGEYFEKE